MMDEESNNKQPEEVSNTRGPSSKSLQDLYPSVDDAKPPINTQRSSVKSDVDKLQTEGQQGFGRKRTHKHRIVRRLAIVVLVLIVISGSWAIFSIISSKLHDDKVAKNIVAQRSAAEKLGDQYVEDVVEFLKTSGVIEDEIAVSKYDVCYSGHDDAGWTITNWRQDCYIRYVNGFTTKNSKEEVRRALLNSDTASESVLTGYSADIYECEVARSSSDSRILPRTINKITYTTIPADGTSLTDENEKQYFGYSCFPPGVYQGSFSVNSSITYDDDLSAYAYDSFDVQTIAPRQEKYEISRTFRPELINTKDNQIWVEQDLHYYSEDIGCDMVLCGNPRSEPVHPEL